VVVVIILNAVFVYSYNSFLPDMSQFITNTFNIFPYLHKRSSKIIKNSE